MKLSKAKELIEAGTHYLKIDCEGNLFLTNINIVRIHDYVFNNNFSQGDMKEIKLSDITDDEEEIVYQIRINGDWIDAYHEIRVKPKPDYSKEIQELENKIAELKKLM